MGVPLGVALLTALGLLWRERRHKQRLSRKVEALNAARDPSPSALQSESVKHQLDDALLEELDGRQVNEMAERRYE